MSDLEISTQTAQRLQALSAKSQKSIDDLLLWLLDVYGQTIETSEDNGVDMSLVLTDDEVAELISPKEPMTGKEIAEAGLLGGWKDLGIEDSADWLAQQRAERRKKINW